MNVEGLMRRLAKHHGARIGVEMCSTDYFFVLLNGRTSARPPYIGVDTGGGYSVEGALLDELERCGLATEKEKQRSKVLRYRHHKKEFERREKERA